MADEETLFGLSPVLSLVSTNTVRWSGLSNLSYTVQTGGVAGSASSATTNIAFTNLPGSPGSGGVRGLLQAGGVGTNPPD